jgi:putative endonuclease
MNKRKIGKQFEKLAEEYLKNKGYQIIAKNFHSQYGEIDIIALKDEILVFIEVKGRNTLKYGYPEESISKKKLNSIIRTAEHFLATNTDIQYTEIRFDIISIFKNNIKHILNITN